jgi:hypothetical protein
MPRRTATIVPAILASTLAGMSLATMARGEPANVEDCLSSPKAETPPGSHWRYHIDHANKRNCWYLRRDGGGVAQAVPQSSPAAAPPAAKPSIADARAELRPQAIREDNPAASPPTNAAGNETSPANASVWNATAAVATRWPDLPAASSAPSTAVPATTALASDATPSDVTPSSADPAPSSPFAYLSMPVRPEMIPTVFAAIVGALAFAAAAALISRRRTRLRRPKVRSARGPIWETTDDDRIVLSDYPSMDNRDYRPRFARNAGSATAASPEFVRRPPRRAAR